MLPILGRAGKINSGAKVETFFRHQHGLNSTEGAAGHGDALRVNFRESLQVSQSRRLVFEMQLHELDELPAACLRAFGLVSAFEKVHDLFAGGAAVAAAMRDEKNVAFVEENWSQIGKPAGTLFAAVVPEDRGKWALAFGFVKEAVENEAANGKSDFDRGGRGLSESDRRERVQKSEQTQTCEGERGAMLAGGRRA